MFRTNTIEPEIKTENIKPTDKELVIAITSLARFGNQDFSDCLQIIISDEEIGYFTVYAKEDEIGAKSKYKLRDDFFHNTLNLIPKNAAKFYHFYISKDEAAKNEIILAEVQELRKRMQKKILPAEKIEGFKPDQKDLIIATTLLNIILPVPGYGEWSIVRGSVRTWLSGNKGEFDVEKTLRDQNLVSDLNYIEEMQPLITKVKNQMYKGHAKWAFQSYLGIRIFPELISFVEKIKAMGKLTLECYRHSDDSLFFNVNVRTEFMIEFIGNYIKSCNDIINQVGEKILASAAIESRSSLPIILDYLFFNPSSIQRPSFFRKPSAEQAKKPKLKNSANKEDWGVSLRGSGLDGYFKRPK